MKELDLIWDQQLFETQRSYTQKLALTVQPQCHTRFGLHPEFDEVFRLWTQGWAWYGLDKSRLWGLILNLKRILAKREGAMAEVGVYKGNCGSVLSYYARQFGRRLYLCDTFEGFDPSQFEEDMGPRQDRGVQGHELGIGASECRRLFRQSLDRRHVSSLRYAGNGAGILCVRSSRLRYLRTDDRRPEIFLASRERRRRDLDPRLRFRSLAGRDQSSRRVLRRRTNRGRLAPDACGSILLTKQA
jgi:hypothetical protein